MADEQPDKSTKPKRRIVKNPETFRERALKAAEKGDKPDRAAKAKEVGSKLTGPVTGTARKAAGTKPLLPIVVVLRFIGRIIFPKYFRSSWQELRQVQWPGWRESRKLTFAVLVFAVIFGLVVAAVDYVLDKVFKYLLLQ